MATTDEDDDGRTGGPGPSPEGAVELRCDELSFTYPGGRRVLVDATFAMASGRSMGLLGPNGAGKSTLLGALVGCLEGHWTGRVTTAGGQRRGDRPQRVRSRPPSHERQIRIDQRIAERVTGSPPAVEDRMR